MTALLRFFISQCMEFRFAIIFLFVYYIRPQDWIPSLVGANIIKPIILGWFISILSTRSRSVLPGLLRSPHDWLMLIYYAYVVWTGPTIKGMIMAFLPTVSFYFLTLHSLTTWDLVLKFLRFWNLMLLSVAAIAVLSLYGVDFTGAKDMTEIFYGRLCIGTWLHNNPNSLGHSVVVAIPLSYLLFFWKGTVMGRAVYFPLAALLAGYCTYMTQSKGSFLVGAGLVVLLFVTGRPRVVQIFAISTAATLGLSALSFLPRMQEMSSLGENEGVQGRLMAWEMARNIVHQDGTGEGWRQFVAWVQWEGESFIKATHSSYVQIGGDLGIYGIFIFIAGLWCVMHTALTIYPYTREDDVRERCRRCVVVMLAGYVVSSWMINREYHAEYFLLIAVAAAMHRLSRAEQLSRAAEQSDQESAGPALTSVDGSFNAPPPADTPEKVVKPLVSPVWNRFGLLDIGVCSFLTWSVLYVWDYVLKTL